MSADSVIPSDVLKERFRNVLSDRGYDDYAADEFLFNELLEELVAIAEGY